ACYQKLLEYAGALQLSPARQLALLKKLGDLQVQALLLDQAGDTYRQCISLAKRQAPTISTLELANMHFLLARVEMMHHHPALAEGACRKALQTYTGRGLTSWDTFQCLAVLTHIYTDLGKFRQAAALSRYAVPNVSM